MSNERKQTLEKLLAMDPDDIFSRYALGLECLTEDVEQARLHFEEVVRRDPKYVAAYFQLGQLHAELGQIAEAEGWLQKGIDTAEQVGDSHALGEMQDFLDQL